MALRTDTIDVPEIHCGHCKSSIEGALAPIAGVQRAVVDVAERTVTVEYDASVVSRSQLTGTIEEQGYDVPA